MRSGAPKQTILEELKARNNAAYPYSDGDINSLNNARNARDGITYWKYKQSEDSEGEIESNILMQGDQPCKDNKGHLVVEMPACDCKGERSPIENLLKEAMNQIERFKEKRELEKNTPVTILFPYKLESFHWNCGKITIEESQKDHIKINGYTYDSYGSGVLGDGIQQQIREFFDRYKATKTKKFNLGHGTLLPRVQTTLLCGGYAARAMHNLKTKEESRVWDEIYEASGSRKTDPELRGEDCELISQHNRKAANSFCKRESLQPRNSENVEQEKQEINKQYLELQRIINSKGNKEIIGFINKMLQANDEYNRTVIFNQVFEEVKGDEDYRTFLFPKSTTENRNSSSNPYLNDLRDKIVSDLVTKKNPSTSAATKKVPTPRNQESTTIQSLKAQKFSAASAPSPSSGGSNESAKLGVLTEYSYHLKALLSEQNSSNEGEINKQIQELVDAVSTDLDVTNDGESSKKISTIKEEIEAAVTSEKISAIEILNSIDGSSINGTGLSLVDIEKKLAEAIEKHFSPTTPSTTKSSSTPKKTSSLSFGIFQSGENLEVEDGGKVVITAKDKKDPKKTKQISIEVSENELLEFVPRDLAAGTAPEVKIKENEYRKAAMAYFKGEDLSGNKIAEDLSNKHRKNITEALNIIRAQPNTKFTPTSASPIGARSPVR